MRAEHPSVTPAGFFVLRTPLLPHDPLGRSERALRAPRALGSDEDLAAALEEDRAALVEELRAEVRDSVVREALFVASPTFDDALESWLADPEDARGQGVVDTLVRYRIRMSARPTPFGLFSGCSVGTLGAQTRLTLAERACYRRHTRLDAHFLAALCESLHEVPAVRSELRFRPNSGLYPAAGQLRYAEARIDPKSGALGYHLVSIERTPHLDATLRDAERGARPTDLAAGLVERDPGIAREEATAFVEQLIANQVLTSDLAPAITGDQPVGGILATLGESSAGANAAAVLGEANRAIGALDRDGLGVSGRRYRAIAEALEALPAKPDLAKLFHVDLYKAGASLELGADVIREMQHAVHLLTRTAVPAERESLRRFREALAERYGERLAGPLSVHSTVPLVEALDEEAGIGFHSEVVASSEPTPLLDGVPLPRGVAGPTKVPFGRRERHLLRRICRAQRERETEWVLDEEDLTVLASATPAHPPSAFALLATLAASSPEALARGDFRLFAQLLSGPSGALLLGRFCHGDPSLRRCVEEHLRAEEAARPDVLFAEIVHLPEGRVGNILCRPSLRRHEIPYLGRSGLPEAAQMPITDLRVGLSRERLVLYSARHSRQVVPRLTSAHNHPGAVLGIYRFLCALQYEDQPHTFGWTWGALEDAPFLPRVSCGRTILSPARWNLVEDQLAPLAKGSSTDRYKAMQRLRAALGLPRWVGLAEGENVFPVDLDNVLHGETLARLVKGRESAALVEVPTGDDLVVSGPEGRFVHELVVPFVAEHKAAAAATASSASAAVRDAAVARTFLPGSEWLYAKLYTGTASADAVLEEVVAPFVDHARGAGIARRWFFIRYGDPEWHVRLRVRGDDARAASALLSALHDAAAPLLGTGRVWKLQLDTYEREVDRYGGPHGIEVAEAIFEADSDAVLSIVKLLESDEGADARWRLTLRGMHLLLVDLGLDLAGRTRLVRRVARSFAAEHGVEAGFERYFAAKFRAERPALEALLGTAPGTDHPLDPGFELLARRSERLAPLVARLSALEREGRLTIPMEEIAVSLLHMHANRLLRSEQRAQEVVLYELLARLYESEAGRVRANGARR